MGGCKCTFRSCNVATQKFPNMSFFHYPVAKKDRLEKWIQHANYACIKNMPTSQAKNRAVCGLHFKDECFMNYKKNRLTPTAVPTLDRLKSGKVLDYSLSENPKPTLIPPTKDEHLIPPLGVLVWGQPPEFWNSYSTAWSEYSSRPVLMSDPNDCTPEPIAKKPKTIKSSETPRILNKGIRLISNVSLNDNYELDDTTTTISFCDSEYPQDDECEDDNVVVDTCNIELAEERPSVTNHTDTEVTNVGDIVNMNNVGFLTVSPMDPVEDSVTKVTLEATCIAYETEMALLKKEMQAQEIENEKEISQLKAALELTKEKLQQSENLATTWKFKVSECDQRVAELETKNQELIAKAAEPLTAVAPKPAATSSSSLSKPQLFNGIKKYLSASMTALVRMEMFGSSERQWKPDEKQVSVELLKLGEDVYTYLRDEWRFRLPPKKMVEQWTNEVAEEDVEDL